MNLLNKLRGKNPSKQELKKQKTQAFEKWLQEVHNMSTDTKLSRDEKREHLRKYIDQLPDVFYTQYFPHLIEIIQKSKENCQPYKNSREQTDKIIELYPRLKDHSDLVLLYIKERRKKYKLEV